LSRLLNKEPKVIKRVMGVDVSTKSFAWCIVEDGRPTSWGELVFDGKTSYARLSDASNKLRALRDYLRADLIVVESSVLIQNKKTVIQLSHAIGASVPVLMTKDTRIEEISPIEWQRLIGNPPLTTPEKNEIKKQFPGKSTTWYSAKGRELRKDRTRQWVLSTLGNVKNTDSDNVTDAMGVAMAGWHKYVKAS
jgi:Holliday junction resolvasome RuvABC endonuclease subunit